NAKHLDALAHGAVAAEVTAFMPTALRPEAAISLHGIGPARAALLCRDDRKITRKPLSPDFLLRDLTGMDPIEKERFRHIGQLSAFRDAQPEIEVFRCRDLRTIKARPFQRRTPHKHAGVPNAAIFQ